MAQIIKETTVSSNSNAVIPNPGKDTNSQTTEYLIYFLFGLLDVLLVFRLFFKLTGASVGSSFVHFIYQITGIFIYPFEGIFHRAVSQGIETASVLEPSTIVAIVVYSILSWGLVMLLRILTKDKTVGE